MENIIALPSSGVLLGKTFMALMTMTMIRPAFSGGNSFVTIRGMAAGSRKKQA